MINRKTRGAAANQYALVLGLIVVLALAALVTLGQTITSLFSSVSNRLGGPANAVVVSVGSGNSGGGSGGGTPTPPGSVTNPVAWGKGTNGMLGDGLGADSVSPVSMPQFAALGGLTSLTSGNGTGCALTSSGTVYCVGFNLWGSLGQGDTTNRSTPIQVKGVGGSGFLTGVTALYTRNSPSPCAMKSGGSLFCWGLLGNNGSQSTTPAQLAGPGGSGLFSGAVEAQTAGVGCVRDSGGNMYCWGNGFWGNLGTGSTGTATFPTQVKGENGVGFLTGVTQIAEGNGSHTCAMASSIAYCWGRNSNGMLGIGTTSNTLYPGKVKGVGNVGTLDNVTWLTAGTNNTCALDSNSNVYCWGGASYGANGNNNTSTDQSAPVQVKGLGGVGNLTGMSLVEAGADYVCAMGGGNVYCWGDNSSGSLGKGSAGGQSAVPLQVVNVGGSGVLSGVTWISVGDRTVYAWR